MWRRQIAATAVIAFLACVAETASAARTTDHVGTWSCVVWGHPDFGDERVLLNFAPEGVARLARVEEADVPSWSGRLRLMRQHAFPPARYMRDVYAPASLAPLWMLYLRRIVSGSRRWLSRS